MNGVRLLIIGVFLGIIGAYLCAVPLTFGQLTVLAALAILLIVTGATGTKRTAETAPKSEGSERV